MMGRNPVPSTSPSSGCLVIRSDDVSVFPNESFTSRFKQSKQQKEPTQWKHDARDELFDLRFLTMRWTGEDDVNHLSE